MVIWARGVPGPGFVAGVVVSTWLDTASPAGTIAWLLIAHPPPRRPGETAGRIEAGLRGMAGALGLRAASRHVPVVGDRLTARGPHLALDYGHPDFCLRVPRPAPRWLGYVLNGGAVCLVVCLDAIAAGAGPGLIEERLRRTAERDRVLVGATGLRHGGPRGHR
ncbi:hypothetical protein [Streptomyces sp. NPDC052496]|uniref:hypothetical protein n=1 Tax=Streptomyces sp. NPDC052496 TaxID=3154951 RepID=UPI003445D436